MRLAEDIATCRGFVHELKQRGDLGLVATMGALHAGHVALMQEAKRRCGHLAVTIFVNPTQFSPGEDYSRYPRTLDADLEKCAAAGADVVFAPTADAMYPAESSTSISVARLARGLCGPFRPGHFEGVATVVAKLFNIIPADVAVFGEKDFQQLVIIRQMARDLNFPIEIVGYPTVREPDGLAMSSRNAYLSTLERAQARNLSQALFAAADRVRRGERNAPALIDQACHQILASGPFQLEYVAVVAPDTLEAVERVERPARMCLAARIGSCRLIDNVALDPAGPGG